MSTILNALKRLEEERREAEISQAPLSMSAKAGGRRRLTLKAGLTVTVLVVVLGAAVLVGLNGGLFGSRFSRKARAPEPPAAAVASDTPEEKPISAAENGRRKAATAEREEPAQPNPSRASAAREVVTPPAPIARQTVPPVFSKALQDSPRTKKTLPDQSPTEEGNATPADTIAQTPPRQIIASESLQAVPQPTKTPSNSGDRQPSSSPEPSREVEALARGVLTLQAISWSEDPGARLTIIDGRILREGDTIDGFNVMQIRPEDVVVGKNGKRWRLAYGNR